MIKNKLRPEVVQQLLFSKSLLSQILFSPETEISSFSIAKKILIAHDAAEIGIAAIANQIEALLPKEPRYLMHYFDPIKNKKHKNHDVDGKVYCRQLNTARNDLKHVMIFPDPNQWARVGDKIYSYLSGWCQEYLKISLDDLDDSILINNSKIKELYDRANKELSYNNYKQVLEILAKASYLLFGENNALRSLQVGIAKAEDAIKLAAFGVHANDFLALQEFLPQVSKKVDEDISIQWTQKKFGHPGNWRRDSASFCMAAFLDMALKIQNAEWIPGPVLFAEIYDYKIEAINDNVEIWVKEWKSGDYLSSPKRKIVKILKKGESIIGMVYRETESALNSLILNQGNDEKPEEINIISYGLHGYVALHDVKITCIPKQSNLVKQYLPNLPIVDMQLD